MKIEFLDKHDIWDLKRLEPINEKIFRDLPASVCLELDVRGCAFDYLSAPKIIELALAHINKNRTPEETAELGLVFEEMTSPEVISEFFGDIVKETADSDLSHLVDQWAKGHNIKIILRCGRVDSELAILGEYGPE